MIHIINFNNLKQDVQDEISGQCPEDRWDYPIEELSYLIETHPDEFFTLYNNRLYEVQKNEF